MNAKKCDKCGKLYESNMCVPDLTISKYTHPYGTDRIDLCDECQKELEDWLGLNKKIYPKCTCENASYDGYCYTIGCDRRGEQ